MSTPPISDIDQLLAENAALRARIADLERQCASRPAADAGVDLPDHTAPATVADLPLDDLLEQLFTHTPLALQIYDRNGTSLRMNEATRRMLGVPDVNYGVGAYNVLTDPWNVANAYAPYYARAYAGEVVHMPEVRVDFGDPTNTWQTGRGTRVLDNLVFPIRDAASQVVAVVSCILDVTARAEAEAEVHRLNADLERLVAERTAQLTETIARFETEIAARRQIEAALRESETRLRQIAEHLDVVVWLEDAATSKTLYVNPAYETLFGRSRAEVYADPRYAYESIHPDDRARWRQIMHQHPTDDITLEYRIVRPDETVRWVWVDIAMLRDESGAIVRRVGCSNGPRRKRSHSPSSM